MPATIELMLSTFYWQSAPGTAAIISLVIGGAFALVAVVGCLKRRRK
jgi:hypothetical protein